MISERISSHSIEPTGGRCECECATRNIELSENEEVDEHCIITLCILTFISNGNFSIQLTNDAYSIASITWPIQTQLY